MNFRMKSTGLLALMVLVLISVGCGQSGISPDLETGIPKFQELRVEDYANHNLWGMWEITYDLEELSATVTPTRDLQAHFNITGMLLPPNCGDCVKVQVNAFNPVTRILDLNVTLKNNTQITGRDVRGIVYTDDYGHLLTNSSAWTGLYDIAGGDDINPFIAFAQNEPNRKFTPGFEDMQNYLISIPDPPMFGSIKYAVDASWPTNCKEPFAIPDGQIIQFPFLDSAGSQTEVTIMVRDWQSDTGPVYISLPEVTGEELTEFGFVNNNIWRAPLVNMTGAPAGEYDALVTAFSENTPSLALYKYIKVRVTKTPVVAPDITPPWFFCHPTDLSCPGDGYAYTTNGNPPDQPKLDIFNITNPGDPIWVNSISYPEHSDDDSKVIVENGYAYLSGLNSGFAIVDVDPPEDSHHVSSLETVHGSEMAVKDGYCYIPEGPFLKILDIDPPEDLHSTKVLPIPAVSHNVAISGNNAYVTNVGGYIIEIVDITTPETASIIGTIETSFPLAHGCKIVGTTAYLGVNQDPSALKILDISDPENPVELASVPVPNALIEIDYSNGYVAAVDMNGVNLIDVEPPGPAHIVRSFSTPGKTKAVEFQDGMMYVANTTSGLHAYDISQPDLAYLAGEFLAADGGPFVINDGLLYSSTFSITDPSPASSFTVLSRVFTGSDSNQPAPAFSNGYAFMCVSNPDLTGMMVIDCADPEQPQIVDLLDCEVAGEGEEIVIQGNHAFIAQLEVGLVIVDISNPEIAQVVTVVNPPASAILVRVHGQFAYAVETDNISVIDLDPIGSAHEVNAIFDDTMDISDIDIAGDFLYISDWNYGFRIMDLSQPETPEFIKTFPLYNARSCYIDNGKAYVSDDVGLRVFDVTDPASAFLIENYDIPPSDRILVDGDTAYIDTSEGLIYDLS